MNRNQLLALWIGILLMVTMLLFPPYLTAGSSHPILYRPLLSPPDLVSKDAPGLMGSMAAGFTGLTGTVPAPLDSSVLLAQLGIVGLLTLGLTLTLKNKFTEHGR